MTADNNEPGKKSRLIRTFQEIINRIKNDKNNPCNFRTFEDLDNRRRDMITGVLNLPNKNARDIMIPRVDIIAVESDTDLKTLVKHACDSGHSRVPVFEETIDNIVGILYAKDLLKLLIDKSRKKFQLKKILHDPFFVPETMPLDELLLEFKARRLHIAVVVDEYGGVGGMVTLEDILEEIVGDITDEYDNEEMPEFEQIGKLTFEVDSRMSINEFNKKMNAQVDEDSFDTIGGFIYDLFGRIPDKGESVRYENMSFKIKDKHGTKIDRIIVTNAKK